MAKKDDAKRAAKKHAKEKKREKKKAARAAALEDVRSPLDRWKPARDGIEGLARLMRVSRHRAAETAEDLAAAGHAGAHQTWHPSRVAALSTESLVDELARRGVLTDPEGFRALAAGYESARTLAEERWFPLLPADATAHDRDLLSEAAVVSWARWSRDRLSDEGIEGRYDDILDALDEGEPTPALNLFFDLLETVVRQGGPERIARAFGGRFDLFGELQGILGYFEEAPPDADRAIARLRALREHTADRKSRQEGTRALAQLLELAARAGEALDELVTEAAGEVAAGGSGLRLLGEATDLLRARAAAREPADPVREARALDALRARIEATDGIERDDFEYELDMLVQALEARDAGGGAPGAPDEDAPAPPSG